MLNIYKMAKKMKNDIPDFSNLVKQSEDSVLLSIGDLSINPTSFDSEISEEMNEEDDEKDEEIIDKFKSKKEDKRLNQMLFLITSNRKEILRHISYKNRISMSNMVNEALDLYIHKRFPIYEKNFKEKRRNKISGKN